MEFTLLFAAGLAVIAGAAALRWEAARGNAADCTTDLWDLLITAMVVGLFTGRIAAMIGAGINPLTALGDILIVRGGVATGPAVIGSLATVATVGRKELLVVADALAVAALAALGGWHLGCVVRDSCLGTPTSLPWAMTQPGSSVGRHPVELYTAAVYLLAAVLLAVSRKRKLAPGLAGAVALTVASLGRLVTEPLRLSLSGGPVWWYLAGSLAGAAGIAWSQRQVRAEL